MNRRELFRLGVAAAGVAAVPWARLMAAAPGPVMTTLSNYMAAAAGRALPSEVVERTKHHILDTFAAMVSGSQLAPGRAAIAFARTFEGDSTALGGVAV